MEKKRMLYQQRTLNFDAPPNAEAQHVAEQTSEPPPHAASPATTLAADTPLEAIRLACLPGNFLARGRWVISCGTCAVGSWVVKPQD